MWAMSRFATPTTYHVGESTVLGCSSKSISEDSMRAYQLPKDGAGIDALVKVERPDPKPAYRQVVVKVKACSLNFRDLDIVRGTYRMPVRENLIPLSDGAGEVIEVGPRCHPREGRRPRRRVFLSALARWRGACRCPRKARLEAASTACLRNMRCWRRTGS